MFNLKPVIFFIISTLSFLVIVESLSVIPGGTCPNKDFVFTGTYTVDMSMTYNSTFPNPMIIIIPFDNAQSNNIYTAGLTIQAFNYIISSNKITLFLTITVKAQSSLTVQLTSDEGNKIQIFGIRYLTIISGWSLIKTYDIVAIYNTWVSGFSYVTIPHTETVPNMNLTGTIKQYFVLTGWEIITSNSDKQFGIKFQGQFFNTTTILLYFYNQCSNPIYVSKISVFVLMANVGQLSASSFGIFTSNYFRMPIYSKVSTAIEQFNSFYGLFWFLIINQTTLNFQMTVLKIPQSIELITQNNMSDVTVYYLIFQTLRTSSQCCPFTYSYFQNMCYDQCLMGYFRNTTQICTPCRRNDCSICSNYTTCQVCIIGRSVIGGCSNVDGCIAIVQNQTATTSICIDCAYPMIFQNQTSTCICPNGYWIVNYLCTNIIGCITTAQQNNVVVCKSCNISKNISLVNGICQCQNGFELNQSLLCSQICGDGKVFFQQQCDDGNKNDGDGCSSACLIQTKYVCRNGSITNMSNCVYYGKDFKINLVSIDKLDYQNKGIFIFKIYPALFNFQKMNFLNDIHFQSSKAASMVEWSYNQGAIRIIIQYTEDIQDFAANITLTFNEKIIIEDTIKLSFMMISKGDKLLIVKKYQVIKILEYILLGFSGFILLLFVVGSLFHKMIGVETLHAFQLLFFIHSLNNSYTTPFSMFKFLTYLNCNFLYFFNKQLNIYHPNNSFPYSSDNKQFATMIIIGSSLFFIFIFGVLKILFLKHNNQQNNRLKKLSVFIYGNILFPIFIGFYWTMSISFTLDDIHELPLFQTIPVSINVLISLIFKAAFGYIFWFEWKGLTTNEQYNNSNYGLANCHRRHICIYLSYSMLINFCLVIQYIQLFKYSQILILGLTSLLLIKYCCCKPYKSSLHNAGIIFNLIMVQLFSVWNFVRNVSPMIVEEDKQILAIGAFFIIMFSSMMICLARIILQAKKCCKSKNTKQQQNNIQTKNSKSDDFDQNQQMIRQLNKMNKYSCRVIQQKQEFKEWNHQNKQRLLNNNLSIYNNIDYRKKLDQIDKVFKQRGQTEIIGQRYLQIVKRIKLSLELKQLKQIRQQNIKS